MMTPMPRRFAPALVAVESEYERFFEVELSVNGHPIATAVIDTGAADWWEALQAWIQAELRRRC